MLIKKADNKDKDIAELKKLLKYDISAKQRFLIEREILFIGSGKRGEESSAYYIDFHFKNSERWAVIHDLRLEHQGFVAQIDHLLINRFLDTYVLESKNYYYGIKITSEGEFLVWNGKTYIGIESPIEQNRRHIRLFEKKLETTWMDILPTKLGIPVKPAFYNYVLISPTSRIDRPPKTSYDTSKVIKADALVEAIDKRVDEMGVVETLTAVTKVFSIETVEAFARSVSKLHRPGKIDYAAKFGISVQKGEMERPIETQEKAHATRDRKTTLCELCGAEVDSKVIAFCGFNKEKFDGKILCRSCQATQNRDTGTQPPSETRNLNKHGTCERCGAAVDSKVIFFCRMNKQKFGGKVLCRDCQAD